MNKDLLTHTVEFYHYNKEKEKRVKSSATLHSSFLFSKNDFALVEWKNYYFVCVIVDGNPISVWNHKKEKDGAIVLPGEAISLFRKGYIKNNITQDMLELFIKDPAGYEAKYKKSTTQAKHKRKL